MPLVLSTLISQEAASKITNSSIVRRITKLASPMTKQQTCTFQPTERDLASNPKYCSKCHKKSQIYLDKKENVEYSPELPSQAHHPRQDLNRIHPMYDKCMHEEQDRKGYFIENILDVRGVTRSSVRAIGTTSESTSL